MKRLDGWIAGMAMVLIGSGAAFAQEHSDRSEHHDLAMPAAKAEVQSADGRITIPFRLSGNHVVIPITIQGTKLDVVLDTGMPMDGVMLYRNEKVERMNLVAEKGAQARVGGAGSESAHVAADIIQGLTIDIEGLRLTNAKAIVAPPVKGFARDHDGIIGASLFGPFVVSIDFDANRVVLDDPKSWVAPKDAVAVPLSVQKNFAFIDVVVLTKDGRRIPTKVVVDLGASHAISLNVGATKGIEVPAGAIRTILGRGLGGEVRGQVGRIAGLEIGGVVLHDVVATFPDAAHQRPGGMDMRGGNLGSDFLQRFHVTFDMARGKMYLLPNKSFERPFEWDMSGLGLEPDEKEGVRVAHIVAGSPAETAGVKVGDTLARVDGRAVSTGDLPSLKQQLKRDGASLSITLTRDGKPIETTLGLKRLV